MSLRGGDLLRSRGRWIGGTGAARAGEGRRGGASGLSIGLRVARPAAPARPAAGAEPTRPHRPRRPA